MGLVFVGTTLGLSWLAGRRYRLPWYENVIGAACLAAVPTALVYWLI